MLAIVQLSKETIIDAAVSILREYGLSDMTMRRVAKQLNVAPGALYWHFKNKQELIDATSRFILAPLLELDGDSPGPEEVCARMRTLMMRINDGAEVVSAGLSNQIFRKDLEHLISHSFSTPHDIGAFTLLHFVIGAVLTEQTQLQLQNITGNQEHDGEESNFEERFTTGVEIIIAGLEGQRHIR